MEDSQWPAAAIRAEHSLDTATKSLRQALIDASDAAHEIDALDPPQDDETAVYDRLMWLGTITDGLSILCTPKLRVLAAALSELVGVDEPARAPRQ